MSIVVARIFGGLGNQMFQYAMGRALARRNNARLLLDISSLSGSRLKTRFKGGRRRYVLDAFRTEGTVASVKELERHGLRRVHGLNALAARFKAPPADPIPVFREAHFHYDPAAYGLAAPVCVDGYWQCASYFDDCEDLIRAEFTPKMKLAPAAERLAETMAGGRSVSLHVRRGDYVTSPKARNFHGLCSLEYYARAIAYMAERVTGAHVFVFSDDLEWTRRNIGGALPQGCALPMTFVNANTGGPEFCDMSLMSGCKHHILANSSYSWWGAWLNPSENKIVVGPRQWFVDEAKDTRDMTPKSWRRL